MAGMDVTLAKKKMKVSAAREKLVARRYQIQQSQEQLTAKSALDYSSSSSTYFLIFRKQLEDSTLTLITSKEG